MTVIAEWSFPWEGSWPYFDPQAFCYIFSHVHLRGGRTEQLRWASGICQSTHYRPFSGAEVMQEPLSLLLMSVICWNRWATSKPPMKNDHFPILVPDPWLGIDWEGMISRPQHFLYVFAFLTHFDGEWSVSSVFVTEDAPGYYIWIKKIFPNFHLQLSILIILLHLSIFNSHMGWWGTYCFMELIHTFSLLWKSIKICSSSLCTVTVIQFSSL